MNSFTVVATRESRHLIPVEEECTRGKPTGARSEESGFVQSCGVPTAYRLQIIPIGLAISNATPDTGWRLIIATIIGEKRNAERLGSKKLNVGDETFFIQLELELHRPNDTFNDAYLLYCFTY